MKSHLLEYVVIGAYLLMMVGIGILFRKFNRNVSDYFRSGSQGTWWLVGTSAFMSSISAVTFTGNGGAAFKAGWSIAAIYLGNVVGLAIQASVLAPWFRQMRATTFPEVVKERFGPITQQYYAYTKVLTFTLYAGLWLYGLAVFCSSIFGFPVLVAIPILGIVALLYPMLGGKWAVMAADFVKGVIMMAVTILLAALCLIKVGGFSGLAELIQQKGLDRDFSFLKQAGEFPNDLYTWKWMLAVFAIAVVTNCGMSNAVKFFAVKDGREARKAAALSAALMLAGTIFWFIPPMTVRLLFESEVLASGLARPEESAIAIVSSHLLPAGMLGMMVVAMMAATMSSLDVGINGNAAIFVKDVLPAGCRLLGLKVPDDQRQLLWAKASTFFFGALIIVLAKIFALQKGAGIFDLTLAIGSMLTVPLTIPTVLGLLIKRAPPWSAIFSSLVASIPSVVGLVFPQLLNFQDRTLISVALGCAAFFVTIPFWRYTRSEDQQRITAFFARMKRPIDYATEVGQTSDARQGLLLGNLSLLSASFVLLLLLIPNPWSQRIYILLLATIIGVIGLLLRRSARRRDPPD